jgi:hypothetical protein
LRITRPRIGRATCDVLQVPLDGFGSFSTARSRRVSGGGGGGLLPDVSKRGSEPLLQLQEVRGRGSNSPEDKFCSPLLAPSPPPLPKRRGRPPGSTKLAAAAAASAASAASSAAVAQAVPAASKKSPPPKRPRSSENDDENQFPEPISAPPLPAKHRSAAASAGGKARDKLVSIGSVDEGDRYSPLLRGAMCRDRRLEHAHTPPYVAAHPPPTAPPCPKTTTRRCRGCAPAAKYTPQPTTPV